MAMLATVLVARSWKARPRCDWRLPKKQLASALMYMGAAMYGGGGGVGKEGSGWFGGGGGVGGGSRYSAYSSGS